MIEVRVTSTVFFYEGRHYRVGDTLTIREDDFVPYIMEKLMQPVKRRQEKTDEAEKPLEPLTEEPTEAKSDKVEKAVAKLTGEAETETQGGPSLDAKTPVIKPRRKS